MKTIFLAVALMCEPSQGCVLVESVKSPHVTQQECLVDLKANIDEIDPKNIEGLLGKGGYFSAACLEVPEGYAASEHVPELSFRLGQPKKFNKSQLPQIDG